MVSRSRRNRANTGQNGPGNASELPGSSMSNQRKGRQEKEQTDALKELTKQLKVLIDTVKVSQRRGGGIASGGTSPSAGAGPASGGAPGAMAGGGMMRGAMGLMGGPAGLGMMGVQMAMMLPFLFQGGGGGAGEDQSEQSLGQPIGNLPTNSRPDLMKSWFRWGTSPSPPAKLPATSMPCLLLQ